MQHILIVIFIASYIHLEFTTLDLSLLVPLCGLLFLLTPLYQPQIISL